MNTIMTKTELLDALHYQAGILAMLVLDDKFTEAKKLAVLVSDLNARLNQVTPN